MVTETEKPEKSTIQVTLDTKKRLDELGGKNDTYEDIIKKLLDSVNTTDPHQSN